MKTLTEIVNEGKFYGWSDLECIVKYFALNGCEEEGVQIISKLSEEKIKKLRRDNGLYQERSSMFGISLDNIINQYGKNATFLIKLIMADMFDRKVAFEELLEKAKEIIPTLPKPIIFWRDTYDKLYEMGIKFKGVE